jgi:hypothetical protein
MPAGWTIDSGREFRRYWAESLEVNPLGLSLVPVVTLSSPVEARMVRVTINVTVYA